MTNKLTNLNSLMECPCCLDDCGYPVLLEFNGKTWYCPNCDEKWGIVND